MNPVNYGEFKLGKFLEAGGAAADDVDEEDFVLLGVVMAQLELKLSRERKLYL